VISADRQAGLAGNATGAENRIKCGEAGGHDRAHPRSTGRRSFNRPRHFDYLRYGRQRPDDGTVPTWCFDLPRDSARGPAWRIDPEPARSCRTPAIPEGRQSGRDIGRNGSHRPIIEHPFYSSSSSGLRDPDPVDTRPTGTDRASPPINRQLRGCPSRLPPDRGPRTRPMGISGVNRAQRQTSAERRIRYLLQRPRIPARRV